MSDFGVAYLAEYPEIVKTILDMTTGSEYLPLRGTCLKVANMFTYSKLGRMLLKDQKWEVHLLNHISDDSSHYLALPNQVEHLFTLNVPPISDLFKMQDQFYLKYVQLKKKLKKELTKTELEFIELVIQVTNRASQNSLGLGLLIEKEPNLLNNPKLFVFVWAMLTLFDLNVNIRKKLFVFLDKFLYQDRFLYNLDELEGYDTYFNL